jgi:rod shape-determining protein MreC
VLALLVSASLVLLTVTFGSSDGGPLHPVRSAAMAVLGPVEDGANFVFKPVRDLFGWFGATFDARGEVKRLRTERNRLRTQVVDGRAALADNEQLRKLLGMRNHLGLSAYGPVTANVIGRAPSAWFATVQIDHGSDDGVRVNQPVVDGNGLVGTISATTPGTAVITLITDRSSGVSSKVLGLNDPGTVVAADGDPGQLAMELVSAASKVAVGDRIITAGIRGGRLSTLFPPNIPVGMVTAVNSDSLRQSGTISVTPQADLLHLENVIVLTNPQGSGSQSGG